MKKSKILIIILVLIIIIFISVLTLKILNKNEPLPFAGVQWIRYENDKQINKKMAAADLRLRGNRHQYDGYDRRYLSLQCASCRRFC